MGFGFEVNWPACSDARTCSWARRRRAVSEPRRAATLGLKSEQDFCGKTSGTSSNGSKYLLVNTFSISLAGIHGELETVVDSSLAGNHSQRATRVWKMIES